MILLDYCVEYNHIPAKLQSLHWLPVKQRIEFKIYVLVYKNTLCFIRPKIFKNTFTGS